MPALLTRTSSLPKPLTRQPDEAGDVVAPLHVGGRIDGFAARIRDAGCQSRKAIRSARSQHDLRTAPGEQKRRRLADAAARARDRDDLAFGS